MSIINQKELPNEIQEKLKITKLNNRLYVSPTLEEFDEIYSDSISEEQFDEIVSSTVEHLIREKTILSKSQNLGIKEIVNVIKMFIPVAKITAESKLNDNIDESRHRLIYYYPYLNKWLDSDNIMRSIILFCTGSVNKSIIRDVKDTLVSTKNLPLIYSNHQSRNIVDQKYDTYIDFSNGRYHIIKDELEPHKPSNVAINTLFYPYEGELLEEYRQKFDEYFNAISSCDQNRELLLKQVYLSMLLGYNPDQKAINLYGPAGSGKSTFIDIGCQLAGGDQNIARINYSQLSTDDYLSQIGSRKVIAGNDNDDAVKFKSLGILKSLISKEPFSYTVKYESAQTNQFNGILIQAFNSPPDFRSKGSNLPIKDRMIITKIDNRFRHTRGENRNLLEEMTSVKSLSQLAIYLITTVDAFNRFVQPDKSYSDEIIEGEDSVKDFYELLVSSGAIYSQYLSRHQLYYYYQQFCKDERNDYEFSKSTFYLKLEEYLEQRGFVLARKESDNTLIKMNRNNLLNHSLLELIQLNDNVQYKAPIRSSYYKRNIKEIDVKEIIKKQDFNLEELSESVANKMIQSKQQNSSSDALNYQIGSHYFELLAEDATMDKLIEQCNQFI